MSTDECVRMGLGYSSQTHIDALRHTRQSLFVHGTFPPCHKTLVAEFLKILFATAARMNDAWSWYMIPPGRHHITMIRYFISNFSLKCQRFAIWIVLHHLSQSHPYRCDARRLFSIWRKMEMFCHTERLFNLWANVTKCVHGLWSH